MNNIFLKTLCTAFILMIVSCNESKKPIDKAIGLISKNSLEIENKTIKVTWNITDSTLRLNEVYNNYDNTSIDLKEVTLFKIHLKNKALSNLDFVLNGKPKQEDIKVSDSLPTYALKEKGVKLSADLENKEHQLKVEWSAILRDSSHYVQQQIKVSSLSDSIYIDKITFLNGKLNNAIISGNVLGSPIVADNYFFGYEHPTALSNVLEKKMIKFFYDEKELKAKINNTAVLKISLEDIELKNNKLLINYLPDNITYGFNIHGISLLEDDQVISEDKHPMYGKASNPDYVLNLPSLKRNANYSLEVELSNTKDCAGQFFLIQEEKERLNFYTKRR